MGYDGRGVAEAIIFHTSGHPTFWSWVVYYFSCSPPESTQLRGRGFAKPRRSRGFAGCEGGAARLLQSRGFAGRGGQKKSKN
ncbi:Protein of unknown function [Cotesia congregata]|uniref:Uncharacterized protein n=1 Tax=Cotesia congregata TaxID=51543 RepID=A0A8J2HGC1_COTCN|nr:Protein of unknown function [Cotesia congregata]